jgi:hypothetical protein
VGEGDWSAGKGCVSGEPVRTTVTDTGCRLWTGDRYSPLIDDRKQGEATAPGRIAGMALRRCIMTAPPPLSVTSSSHSTVDVSKHGWVTHSLTRCYVLVASKTAATSPCQSCPNIHHTHL